MKKKSTFRHGLVLLALALAAAAPSAQAAKLSKVCFSFQDLETEFWVAGHQSITRQLKSRGVQVIERNANENTNKQLEQVKDCITQKVDAIIAIPQDGAGIIPVIKAANQANIPIALFNREPAKGNTALALVVMADNEAIAEVTVQHMATEAKKLNRRMKPLIMVGDLGDPNAVARKRGFDKVIAAHPGLFEKPVQVATKWDAATALAGLQNAIQANPGVDFLFTSSDFMFPQIRQVLSAAGKWAKIGDARHVILGGLDGDATACNWMKEGYVDATGVQNLYFEAEAAVNAIVQAVEKGETRPSARIQDKGFALTQANFAEMSPKTWGCMIGK